MPEAVSDSSAISGAQLRQARDQADISRLRLAAAMGVSESRIANLERDAVVRPNQATRVLSAISSIVLAEREARS